MDLAVKLVIGLLVALVIFRLGTWLLRGFAAGVPPTATKGDLVKVNLRYRCSICGAEIRMTAAPNEEPEPPRHCQEDMELVAPTFE
ncbi:MAG TPA: hypothetical protein VHN98_11285 [Acidimicrobiales bacterium]|nr:hypothetical protein [Acidimicrobiales bacterium]